MLDLWLRILDIMDRLMNSGQGDNLEEAVPESLKNILLVMADGGFIQPPSDGSPPTELWDETYKRVDRFLPHLIAEVFPQVNAPGSQAKSPTIEDKPSAEPAAAQAQASKAQPLPAVEQRTGQLD